MIERNTTRHLAGVLAAVVLTSAAVAPAWAQSVQRKSTESGLTAIGTAQSFEVLSKAGAGNAEFQCAAGDFARSRLRAKISDSLVMTRGEGPSQYKPGRRAVVFSMAPGGSGSTVGAALAQCNLIQERQRGGR